ncbi:FtsX-like permease family protein [Luedemannella flava]
MILLGVPLGYALGHAAVALVAWLRFDTVVGPSLDTLPYAAAALGGALVAAFFGLRRELSSSVAELLRRVAGRGQAWRSVMLEVLVVALAVAAAFQLRQGGGGFEGIATLLPGLVIAAVALLAARAVVPLAGMVARTAMRRGRLGLGLAAVQLARRPGSHRLLVLLTVATALLGFAAAGVDVAARARHDRATIAVGADSVVRLDSVSLQQLLSAVRKVDPAGEFAMAVAPVPTNEGDLPGLAVDTSRLATVAQWRPDFGPADAGQVAKLLRPATTAPFVVKGTALTVDVANTTTFSVEAKLSLTPLNGNGAFDVSLGMLRPGRHVPGQGARLRGRLPDRPVLPRHHGLGPDRDRPARSVRGGRRRPRPRAAHRARPVDERQRPGRLRGPSRRRRPAGVRLRLDGERHHRHPRGRAHAAAHGVDRGAAVPQGDHRLRRPAAGRGAGRQAGVAAPAGHQRHPRRPGVPGLRGGDRRGASTAPRWLTSAAPADVIERLRGAGLPVRARVGIAGEETALGWEGSALALWFYVVAAAFGILLAVGGIGLVAAVDRRRRADDLRFLRWQGLRRRDVRRAALWGNLTVVLAGSVLGLGAAALAWIVAGDQLPIFVDNVVAITPPRWPAPGAVLAPWAAAAVLFAVAAAIVAAQLRRAVARNGSKGTLS